MPLLIDSNQAHAILLQGFQFGNATIHSTATNIQSMKTAILEKVDQIGKDFQIEKYYAECTKDFIADGSNIAFSFASGFTLSKGLYNPDAQGRCRQCCKLSSQAAAAALLAIPLITTQNAKEAITNFTTFMAGVIAGRYYYNILEVNHSLKKQNVNLQAQVTEKNTEKNDEVVNKAMELIAQTHTQFKPKAKEEDVSTKDPSDKEKKASDIITPPVSVRNRRNEIEKKAASSSSSSSTTAPAPAKGAPSTVAAKRQ